MKTLFWLAMAGALSLTTPAFAQERVPVAPTTEAPADTIIYETTSWGRVTYHLEVHRDGRLRAWRHEFRTGARLEERDEQRGPTLYQQALAAIAPLSPPPTLDCSGAMTDGPSGTYRWHGPEGPRAYDVYYGCYSVDPLPAANAIAATAEDQFFALVRPLAAPAP